MKKLAAYIFLILSILLLVDCLMYYFFLMSFAGYYSDLILFWLWFFVSIAIIILFWKKIIAKLLLTAIILALIGSILPLMIPFYALAFSMTPAGLRMDKDLNENYRAQIVGYSAMAHPQLEIIEKKGILERKIITCSEMDILRFKDERINVKYEAQLRPNLKISEAKDILFKEETDSTIILTLFYGNPNKTLTFNKVSKRLLSIEE